MPLRSVEAATRDDAIAAAREQFGASARVVGVRRVRSGGVLGFFATERYVAEVDPDQSVRPAVPVPARPAAERQEPARPAADRPASGRRAPDRAPLPLTDEVPLRSSVPARNGAAAWAAEARSGATPSAVERQASAAAFPSTVDAPARDVRPRTAAASPSSAGPSPSAPQRRVPAGPGRLGSAAQDPRIDELAGLLAGRAPAPDRSAAVPARTARVRDGLPEPEPARPSVVRGAPARPAWSELLGNGSAPEKPAAPEPAAAPSPFTAALARMVAGDRDVRQAVEEALAEPAPVPAAASARQTPDARTDTSAPARPVHQEEEPVELQDWTPFVPPEDAATGDPAARSTPSVQSREEAIAEVLRAALAQGRSDEALAGLLRKVMDGASPQTALAEPVLPEPAVVESVVSSVAAEPIAPVAVEHVVPVAVEPVAPVAIEPVEPVAVEPVAPVAPVAIEPVEPVAPVAVEPLFTTPLTLPASVVETAAAPVPVVEAVPVEAVPVEAVPIEPVAVEPLFTTPLTLPAPVVETAAAPAPVVETTAVEPVAVEQVEVGPNTIADLFAERTPAVEPAADRSAPTTSPARATTRSRFDLGWDDDGSAELWGSMAPSDPAGRTGPSAAPTTSATTFRGLFDEPAPSVAPPAEEETTVAPAGRTAQAVPVEIEPALSIEDAATGVVADVLVQASAPEPATGGSDPEPVAAEPVATEPAATEPVATEPVATEPVATEPVPQTEAAASTAAAVETVAPPSLARTAGDPDPVSLDATTVMPPLFSFPALSSSRPRGGRPPVPGAKRPPAPAAVATGTTTAEPAAQAAHEAPATSAAVRTGACAPGAVPTGADRRNGPLATVTRLPLAPVRGTTPSAPRPAGAAPSGPLRQGFRGSVGRGVPVRGDVVAQLAALGLPETLLGPSFADEARVQGTYAALTRALAARLPELPELPTGAGEVLVVVGPGVETLRAARALAASMHLDTDRVQWATRGDLAGLAPASSRATTIEAAIDRRQEALGSGTLTVVAVDAPLRADAWWTAQMLAVWHPVAVWAMVEATRKPEDLGPWLDALPRIDALVVQDTDLSADPAAVLRRVALPAGLPVAVVDGVRATPHRWASLLCERLETPEE